MAIRLDQVLVVNESLRMLRSVKAVLDQDGYSVRILSSSQIQAQNQENQRVLDALSSIRKVRKSFPRMTSIVLIPLSNS